MKAKSIGLQPYSTIGHDAVVLLGNLFQVMGAR
jgi:hypothetical protein